MNTEFKKLANNPVWASNASSSDRHEISSASPAITRTDGFGKFYSLPKGQQVEYQTMNQLLRELSAAAKEVVNGVPQWDSQVPYKIGSTTFYNGNFYIAIADSTNRIPSSYPSSWKRVDELYSLPDPVRDVEFDVSDPAKIKIKWAQGKDNGSRVSYSYSWRFASGSGNANASTTYSNISINTNAYNIPDGDVLIISIIPHNSTGGTPVNLVEEYRSPKIVFTAPAGGRHLPLAAARGNGRALLSWVAPTNTGGRPILGYTIQWKTEG
ncbi:MAG: hypothetical protein ISN29_02145, partial [Gammaproteobacteria bacterium AqS3]|nr:hypothetical protein [Gammaproteobacteria bacterium AqS3]